MDCLFIHTLSKQNLETIREELKYKTCVTTCYQNGLIQVITLIESRSLLLIIAEQRKAEIMNSIYCYSNCNRNVKNISGCNCQKNSLDIDERQEKRSTIQLDVTNFTSKCVFIVSSFKNTIII